MIRVAIPSHLASYTGGDREVSASGDSLGAVLDDLESRHRGLRFRVVDEQDRIRRHIRFFIGSEMARSLADPVDDGDLVTIVAALSGGADLPGQVTSRLPCGSAQG